MGCVFRYKEGSYSAAVCLYSDSIMYDTHDALDANDTRDAETDKTDDTDTQVEHNISRYKVVNQTEEIIIDKTSCLDPDKDAVMEHRRIV